MNQTLTCLNTQLKEPTLKWMGKLMGDDTTIEVDAEGGKRTRMDGFCFGAFQFAQIGFELLN